MDSAGQVESWDELLSKPVVDDTETGRDKPNANDSRNCKEEVDSGTKAQEGTIESMVSNNQALGGRHMGNAQMQQIQGGKIKGTKAHRLAIDPVMAAKGEPLNVMLN